MKTMSISDQIIAVIDNLCEKFGIAIDWTADNVMPYIETLCGKFINYEIATSVFWIWFMSCLSVLLWVITLILHRDAKRVAYADGCFDYERGISWAAGIAIAVSAAVSFAAVCVIGTQIHDIVVAKTFPEKVLYDYISGLIQSNS